MRTTVPSEVTTISVDPRRDPRWRTLAATARGSLFTSPPWIRAVSETYGYSPQARVLTDGAESPLGGFVWVPISDIRGNRLLSLPFSDRAEPILADPTSWPSLVDDALSSKIPLQIRCWAGTAPTTDPNFTPVGEAAWHGTQLDAPLCEIFDSLKSAARRNISAAHRNGVRVEASGGVEAVRDFHRLHVSLRKNKFGLLAQPIDLFERIWQEFSEFDGVVTLLARVDGDIVAGAVFLIWNDVLYYKFGASLSETLRLRPNDALAWTALTWASERKLRMVDWGLSDLQPSGLVEYKRKWASEERRILTVRSAGWEEADNRESSQLFGELTRLLTGGDVPDHITERAGALLYRYFA